MRNFTSSSFRGTETLAINNLESQRYDRLVNKLSTNGMKTATEYDRAIRIGMGNIKQEYAQDRQTEADIHLWWSEEQKMYSYEGKNVNFIRDPQDEEYYTGLLNIPGRNIEEFIGMTIAAIFRAELRKFPAFLNYRVSVKPTSSYDDICGRTPPDKGNKIIGGTDIIIEIKDGAKIIALHAIDITTIALHKNSGDISEVAQKKHAKTEVYPKEYSAFVGRDWKEPIRNSVLEINSTTLNAIIQEGIGHVKSKNAIAKEITWLNAGTDKEKRSFTQTLDIIKDSLARQIEKNVSMPNRRRKVDLILSSSNPNN